LEIIRAACTTLALILNGGIIQGAIDGIEFGARDLGGAPRKGFNIFALTGYKRLLGKYANSPVVRDAGGADQFLAVIGVAYGF
jgi:hypothetical protein